MYFHNFRNFFITLLHTISVKALSLCKISYIVGSKAAFFSAVVCAEPVIGAVASPLTTLIYLCARFLFACCFYASSGMLLLVYQIPLACGTGYLALRNSSVYYRLLMTSGLLGCIALFVLHPVGAQVSWYSLLWLIPAIILWVKPTHFFYHALASTLTSHAVGTILWLWLTPTTVNFWITLFPCALIERLLFALCMTGYYYALMYTQQACSQFLNFARCLNTSPWATPGKQAAHD